jgi:threonine/homoserine/homoserine lactone efflux protein
MRARPRMAQALEKLAGACLIVFGLKLAMSR